MLKIFSNLPVALSFLFTHALFFKCCLVKIQQFLMAAEIKNYLALQLTDKVKNLKM